MVEQKVVNLALQGGGSHGAFTWGVLDRLLDEERLSFEGITASSAGSVNAAVFAYGLAIGGRDGARTALHRFWKRMSETTAHGMLQPSLLDRMKGKFGLEYSPGYLFIDALTYFTSPDFFNPLNHNPVKTVIEEIVNRVNGVYQFPIVLHVGVTSDAFLAQLDELLDYLLQRMVAFLPVPFQKPEETLD